MRWGAKMYISNEVKLTVLDYLGGSEAEVFACTLESANACEQLVLHATPSSGLSTLRERLQNTLRELGTGLSVAVRIHDSAELVRNRSLQDLAEAFGAGEIVYDPVGAIESARAAVAQSKCLRERQPDSITGIYYSTQKRELYLTLASSDPSEISADASGPFPVRIVQCLPRDPLIAVDRASIEAANDAWYASTQAKRVALTASLLIFMGVTQAPDARAEGQAVSGMNGKVSVEGGNYDGTNGSVLYGSFSAPLGQSYGVQLDGSTGRYMDADYSGAGAHIFWRDPDRGLLGIVGSSQKLSSIDQNMLGVEAEGYFGNFSLGLRAGHLDGDRPHGGFTGVKARWYVNENVAINLGYEGTPGQNDSKLGVEWQPGVSSLPGISLFAETVAGSNNYDRNVVGLRYYFGANKSLIQRHRHDDPDTLLPDGSSGMVKTLRDSRTVPALSPCSSGQTHHNGTGACGYWGV